MQVTNGNEIVACFGLEPWHVRACLQVVGRHMSFSYLLDAVHVICIPSSAHRLVGVHGVNVIKRSPVEKHFISLEVDLLEDRVQDLESGGCYPAFIQKV